MINGGKLNTEDGQYQVAVFPSQDMYITQGTNTSYSHRGTKNTDNASGSGRKILYAPCDMRLVANNSSGGYGIVIYHTVDKVQLADGSIDHFTLVLMHDNNASRWEQGKIYRQGEAFYEEGDADPSGMTTGIHVHFEVAKGHVTQRVKTDPNGYYHIINPVYLDEIFFKNMTNVIRENAPSGQFYGDHTFVWKEYQGGIEPDPDPKPDVEGVGIYHAMLSKAFPNGLW